jgi:dolichol-phosphate mannosyltransferase
MSGAVETFPVEPLPSPEESEEGLHRSEPFLLPPGPHSDLEVDASVILPTFNERENVERILQELDVHLIRLPYRTEIVVVDDNSPDGTAQVARTTFTQVRTRVLIRRDGRGLSSAILWGSRSTRSRACLVLDADGSHPVDMAATLLTMVLEGKAEMAIASRYMHRGGSVGWPWYRRWISRLATWLARPLTPVKDPLSGFFAVKTSVLQRTPLQPLGYKLGLEILVRARPDPVLEVPFVFRERWAGRSKLGSRQIWEYAQHLGKLYMYRLFSRSPRARKRPVPQPAAR